MDTRLVKFLKSREIPTGTKEFTHTSLLPNYKRLYNIADADLEEFYDIYCNVILEGGVAGLTEKPQDIVPIIVDVDLQWPVNGQMKRIYTREHLQAIVKIYQDIIAEIALEPTNKMFYCCVLEKTTPRRDGDVYKDGFHLHFPNFYTEKWVQSDFIRPLVIKKVKELKIFDKLPLTNTLDKIFDAGIPKNVWLMYGSRKDPQREPWSLTKRYNRDMELMTMNAVFKKAAIGKNIVENLPRLLSIRQDYTPTPLHPSIVRENVKKKMTRQKETTRSYETILEEMIVAEKLLPLLSDERADSYEQWMEIGWILYCISEGDPKGLNAWIEFSQRSEKFQEGVCEKEWERMSINNFTLKSLKYYAQQDSPAEYLDIKHEMIDNYLHNNTLNTTEHDVAEILYLMFQDEFLCADVEKETWFYFHNHRWQKSPKGIDLSRQISGALLNKYARLIKYYAEKLEAEENHDQKSIINARIGDISKLMLKLKRGSFKKAIMREALEFFEDRTFLKKMDDNPHLLVFENGVYDAKRKIFRDGRPDDYCTKCTNLYYKDFSFSDPKILELENIFKKIFVKKTLYKFFEQTISDTILGGSRHKIFVIWTGCGDNGKSVIADLLKHAYGDYHFTPPTTLLTGKQGQSGNATAELMPCKGARVIVVSETSNDDVLNGGTMKKLTGGDPIYARGLYSEGINFTTMAKLILHCNKKPGVSAEDKASWNRIRILDFESTFVKAHLAPATIEEQIASKTFPMDKSLKDKLPDLAQAFIWWLIKKYEYYGDSDLYEPKQVQLATSSYHKANDFYMLFFSKQIQITDNPDDYLTEMALYKKFKDWYKETNPNKSIPNMTAFTEGVEKMLGKSVKGVWRGVRQFDPELDLINASEKPAEPGST